MRVALFSTCFNDGMWPEVPKAMAVAQALAGVGRVVVPAGVPFQWLADLTAEIVPDEDPRARDLDAVGGVLTGAAVGIAVTGTVVLDHGSDQGRRALTLVPDLHVCVILESQLVADLGAGIARLAGASATSDIELECAAGVQGARTLKVLLVRASEH